MLTERIVQALGVLGGDESVQGTLRQQASSYLGEEVDDRCLSYLRSTAKIVYEDTYARARAGGFSTSVAKQTALANVMVAGMAIGKRLGIEDGERFAREVEDVGKS